MSDEPLEHREPHRRTWGCVVLALVVLPIVYVLSVPFVYLVARSVDDWTGMDMEGPFMVFYYPIIFLYDSYEPVRTFFDWYFELFPWLP